MSSIRRVLCLTSASLLVALLPAAAGQSAEAVGAAPRQCIGLGIGSNYQWTGNLPNAAADLPKLRREGITTVREDIYWNVVQPDSARQWDWSMYDRLFTTMTRQRVRILPIIGYGTTWASRPGTYTDMPRSIVGRAAYARFAGAVVARYGPGGQFWRTHRNIAGPLPIRAVELWNEPWYAPHPSVRSYVALVRGAGSAIRRISRHVLIAVNVDDRWTHVADSTTPFWGEAVLRYARALAPFVDRWAIHPYSEGQWTGLAPAADSLRQVLWVQQQLRRAHVGGQVWVTELGYSSAPPPPSSKGFRTFRSQSASYAAFFRAVARMTGPHRVSRVWVFTAARPTSATVRGSWDFGFNLVSVRGNISPSLRYALAGRCA